MVTRTSRIVIAIVLIVMATGIVLLAAAMYGDDTPRGDAPRQTGCGVPIERYDEATLHRAYEMTKRMSRPDAPPMWDDEQLRLSLDDARFVAELERHICEMEGMLGR